MEMKLCNPFQLTALESPSALMGEALGWEVSQPMGENRQGPGFVVRPVDIFPWRLSMNWASSIYLQNLAYTRYFL